MILPEPAALSRFSSAISFNAPPASVIASRNTVVFSAPCRKVLNADTLRLSVSSRVVAKSTPESRSFTSAGVKSSNDFTGCPRATASFPEPSARFKSIFLVAVAAEDASKPLSASTPSRAIVSSMENPKVRATGAIVERELSRNTKSKADFVVATAKVETTRSISVAGRLKARRAAPATFAAAGNSASTASAKRSTCSVACNISV